MRIRPGDRGPSRRARRSRLRRTLVATTVLALGLSACSGEEATDDEGEDQTATAAVSGDPLVIAVASLGSENFSPHIGSGGQERPVVYSVYERLIQTDPETREYLPGLVSKWEVSDDNLQWTFTLRDDVPFHAGPDGQDYGLMTAEDVKFSFELVTRDDSLLGRAGAYRRLIGEDYDNFEIVDDHTIRLALAEPSAIVPALFNTTINSLPVTSKAYWDEVGEEVASAHPVGTGPWKFESFEPGVGAKLSAVTDHWRKAPEFPELEYRIIPDDSAQLAQLRTGDVDFATLPLALLPEEQEDGLTVFSVPNVGVSSLYLGGWFPGSEFDDADSPWIQRDDPEAGRAIREAISVAIDREGIVNELLAGEGEPLVGPVHFVGGIAATDPEWVGDGAQVPDFDPDRARELLAEGGYPDGFDAQMMSFEVAGLPFTTDISEAVASMLRDVGINIEEVRVQEAEYDEMREARGSAGVIWQYIQQPLAQEPGDRFSAFMPADSGAEFFYEGMEEIVAGLRSEQDFEARMARAQELGQDMVDCICPAIGIAAVNAQWVAGPDVADWEYILGLPEIHNTEYMTPAS